MHQTDTLESAIRQELAQVGTCTLEELNERLPYYSWNQVFAAVDRLSRENKVTLQRPDSSDYILSLAPRRSERAHQHVRSDM
jgi:hypothetical protein